MHCGKTDLYWCKLFKVYSAICEKKNVHMICYCSRIGYDLFIYFKGSGVWVLLSLFMSFQHVSVVISAPFIVFVKVAEAFGCTSFLSKSSRHKRELSIFSKSCYFLTNSSASWSSLLTNEFSFFSFDNQSFTNLMVFDFVTQHFN